MSSLQHSVRLFVDHYGLLALFILLTIEEAGIWLPLPGDLLIVYFGYLVARSPHPILHSVPVLLVVTAAVICGSSLLYIITRRFGWLVKRFSRAVHFDERRLEGMEQWLRKRGPAVIIPGRLVPGLRIPTTVVCGVFRVPWLLFLPSVATAAFIWALIYFVIGAAGHELARSLRGLLSAESSEWLLPLLLALALAALVVGQHRLRARTSGR